MCTAQGAPLIGAPPVLVVVSAGSPGFASARRTAPRGRIRRASRLSAWDSRSSSPTPRGRHRSRGRRERTEVRRGPGARCRTRWGRPHRRLLRLLPDQAQILRPGVLLPLRHEGDDELRHLLLLALALHRLAVAHGDDRRPARAVIVGRRWRFSGCDHDRVTLALGRCGWLGFARRLQTGGFGHTLSRPPPSPNTGRRPPFRNHDRRAGDLRQLPPLPLRRRLVAVGRGDDAGHATKPVRPWSLARWVFRCLLLEEVGQIVIALSDVPTNVPFTATLRQGGGFVSPCRCALPIYCRIPSVGHRPPSFAAKSVCTAVKNKRSANNVASALFPKAWTRGNYGRGPSTTDEPRCW